MGWICLIFELEWEGSVTKGATPSGYDDNDDEDSVGDDVDVEPDQQVSHWLHAHDPEGRSVLVVELGTLHLHLYTRD